ncbi:two-component system activity regulator YycH [Jeotgalibaca sp. MA1X17-3]|uniref:two-component system activity regulator YycH n=1 Tax=Jeotgalibaca sp. MA1X17-3 TaxID=2908211 RepID=UPI002105A404|nr:two-component system activity regulator YycH [Jeotgalibaca sp. MA1X17-3]
MEPLLALYTKNIDEFIPANAYIFSNGIVFMPQERVTVPTLVYLAEKQSTSFFINELFDDTTELRDNSDDFVISYSDNISELRISKDSGILYYYRNNLDRTSILAYRQVRNSFHELKFLDTWPGLSLYDGYDSATDQITYRRYVSGIPIYDTKGMGAIRMKMANSGSTEIQFPTQIIQTPLEDRQKNVELPMGEEIIATLESKGYSFSDIEMIEIAYEWSNSDESNRIVELTPRWFVKMKGTWRTLDSWLIALGEETENGL